MAVGKVNKKGGLKVSASKKKTADAFTRKSWHNVVAPDFAKNRVFTKLVSNKDTSSFFSSESLKGRKIYTNLSVLGFNETEYAISLRVQEVLNKNCVTLFDRLEYTMKPQFPERKCTLVTAYTDVRLLDGYTLRVKVCGVTGKQLKQLKSTCYANNRHTRALRQMMQQVVTEKLSKDKLNNAVNTAVTKVIENEIQKRSRSIYSLAKVQIFTMKVIKSPTHDLVSLLSYHGDIEQFKATLGNAMAGIQYKDVGEKIEEVPQAAPEDVAW